MPSTIRNRLIAVVAISLIPSLALFILRSSQLNSAAIESVRGEVTRSVDALAAQERLLLNGGFEALRILSASNAVRDMNVSQISSFLRQLVKENSQYANLIATDPSGMVIASGVPVDPFYLSDREYLKKAIEQKIFIVGPYSISSSTGLPIIPMALPVLDARGELQLVLIASLRVDSLYRVVEDAFPKKTAIWELIDKKGYRVFRYPIDSRFPPGGQGDQELLNLIEKGSIGILYKQYKGNAFPTQYQGRNYFAYSVEIDIDEELGASFRILHVVQADVQRGGDTSPIGYILAIGLFSLLISISIAAFLYTRTVGKKLGHLVDQAAALAFDEEVVTWNPIDGEDEIDLIRRILKESAQEIKRRDLERELASRVIENSLGEKEVLLKEVHHRVKNNFQIISSLLSLQTMSIEDEGVLHLLQESRDRIQSMALIHERLYRSENFSCIDFGEYARSILEQIASSYGPKVGDLAIEIDAGEAPLVLDTAVPLALLLNEVLTNIYKHAFPDQASGKIQIKLHPVGQGEGLLVVQDDGVGLSSNFESRKTGSLGMELIHTLTSQIRGTLLIQSPPPDCGRGTNISVRFLLSEGFAWSANTR